MPRPPLPIGTYGNITAHTVAGGFCAVTRFRDLDGVTRKVKRVGPTAAVAKNRLREELRDRARQGPTDGLTRDARFSTAAAEWLEGIDLLVSQGRRSPTTAQLYRLVLATHVEPGLGELRLRELTVPRLDRFVQTVQLHKGAPTAKLVRTVVSGVLGLAVRHGAIASNPVRDIGRIDAPPARAPRAWNREE